MASAGRNAWRAAWVALAVAIVSLALVAVRWTRPAPARAPRVVDVRVAPPDAWESLPISAHLEPKWKMISEGTFGGDRYAGRIGDLVVTWDADVCSWGGSACAQFEPNFRNLAVGDPDDGGKPMIATGVSCQGTPPFLRSPMNPDSRTCSIDSLALRQSADGTFVVSVRDPDAVDRLVVAFVRRPVKPGLLTAHGRESLAFATFPFACVVIGLFALGRAHRYHRRGGILSWRDATIGGARVLVAPDAELEAAGPYRDRSIDGKRVHRTSRDAAEMRAWAASIAALSAFALASIAGALAAAIIR